MKLTADDNINAVLCLSDGKYFFGKGIGITGETTGEVCFNTSITGYQEILTDPSYAGQIIIFTFPHIGNVGCNIEDNEASKISCKGLVIREDITDDSNFRSQIHLNEWLINNKLTGICGIDTRSLTTNIRENGARNIIISSVKEGEEIDTDKLINKITNLPTLKGAELTSDVSTKKPHNWEEKYWSLGQKEYETLSQNKKKYKIVVIDYGIKNNILRSLANKGFDIQVVPSNTSSKDIMSYNPDGIFLSNGPGDPFATAKYASPIIKELLDTNVPMFGICMGHQLLSITIGLDTIKMHQGHRGANHPVKNLSTGNVEITSQNHGFCVSKKNVPDNVRISHLSLFDNTVQGIELKDKPVFCVQYHPESSPGPHDSRYLFEKFATLIEKSKCQN